MNSTKQHWIPAGVPKVLSVQFPGNPVTRELYLQFLQAHLDELIQADLKEARRALEMSQENAPELWAIAEQNPSSQWARALVQSDQLNALLPSPWSGDRTSVESSQNLREMLEVLA